MCPVYIVAFGIWVAVERALGRAFANPPVWAIWLVRPWCKRCVDRQVHIGGDHRKAEAFPDVGGEKA